LQDLQLRKVELRVTDAVGGNVEDVLEEGDSPARDDGDVPRLAAQAIQVQIPRGA
jgi:hypothetical protein